MLVKSNESLDGDISCWPIPVIHLLADKSWLALEAWLAWENRLWAQVGAGQDPQTIVKSCKICALREGTPACEPATSTSARLRSADILHPFPALQRDCETLGID